MTPTDFLRQRNIVAKNKTDLMIGFNNGTEESLIELLESYHKSELKLLGIANVTLNEVALCDCFRKEKTNMLTGMYCKKHKIFFSMEHNVC